MLMLYPIAEADDDQDGVTLESLHEIVKEQCEESAFRPHCPDNCHSGTSTAT